MVDAGSQSFIVRPLQSPASLDGAFRVHLAPEHLEQLRLKVGDLCEIADSDGGSLGHGIAWRATEGMSAPSKTKHAKVSDTLRTAFNIKEGHSIRISPTTGEIVHADRVVLTDVSISEAVDDKKWRTRIASTLDSCECIARGMNFDVKSKKGSRRFLIDNIESTASSADSPKLFYSNDDTKIELVDPGQGQSKAATGEQSATWLSSDHIGGLVEQLEDLNSRMMSVLRRERRLVDEHVLIHGYEGTGKSLILEQTEKAGFRKVIRLNLNAGTTAKNHALIEEQFRVARASQPSLVLMDKLDKMCPSTDDQYADAIVDELKKLNGLDVLAIGACRSPNDVNSSLLNSRGLWSQIELPIPDRRARSEILNVLLDKNEDPDGSFTKSIGIRTHGFTGDDLNRLIKTARRHAFRRYGENIKGSNAKNLEDGLPVRLNNVTEQNGSTTTTNGENGSLDAGSDSDRHFIELKTPDVEFALTQVRPTALRALFFEKPQTKWSDIGGSKALKEQLDEIIGWPLYYADMLEEEHRKPEKGLLLYGPPGCAKTLTAQAVANSYDLNFIAIKGAELVSMYVGESERAVREVFRKARAAAPCIVFLDEIDSIASERDSSGTKGLNVLTTLLTEMDGFQSLKGVFVLGATNKPEALDTAIMRPGRLGKHLYLGLPDRSTRKEILSIVFKGTTGQELDFSTLELDTDGYTGAEIVDICNTAKDLAIARRIQGATSGVRLTDLEAALKRTKKSVTPSTLNKYAAFGKSAWKEI